jgi:hypothetical protein
VLLSRWLPPPIGAETSLIRVSEFLGLALIVKWGSQPVNLQAGAYYNAIRPDYFANWNFRLQVVFMFPK